MTGVVTLPDVRTEDTKAGPENAAFSEWGPVFRVDVLFVPPPDDRPDEEAALLLHDGTFGSAMNKFDGDAEALTRYDTDPRALPFAVLGKKPEQRADHRLRGRQRDPRLAALRRRRRSKASSSTR